MPKESTIKPFMLYLNDEDRALVADIQDHLAKQIGKCSRSTAIRYALKQLANDVAA